MSQSPVWIGMPETDRTFDVPRAAGGTWGNIRCGGACKDDYARIAVYHQTADRVVVLQRAALDSFRASEAAIGGLVYVTGSIRSCDLQRRLYATDRTRYAPPDKTAHCRGLAIDVSQNQSRTKLDDIRDALLGRGWHRARPTDEPWHYSFGIQV